MQEFLANAVARCLNHLMLALLPSDRRAWGKALVAEQHEITNARERLTWAAGGIFMSAHELMRDFAGLALVVWGTQPVIRPQTFVRTVKPISEQRERRCLAKQNYEEKGG